MVYEVYDENSWNGMNSYEYLSHHGIQGQKWGR